MPGRSRIYVQGEATIGQGQSLDIQFLLPFNATLLQVLVKLGNTPFTLDLITLAKVSVSGFNFDVTIRTFNPGQALLTDIICNEHFEFRKGDTLILSYPNDSDIQVGAECVLKEAD